MKNRFLKQNGIMVNQKWSINGSILTFHFECKCNLRGLVSSLESWVNFQLEETQPNLYEGVKLSLNVLKFIIFVKQIMKWHVQKINLKTKIKVRKRGGGFHKWRNFFLSNFKFKNNIWNKFLFKAFYCYVIYVHPLNSFH